eukprot:CCRYP_011810-RA/>CCRYP_011810-RA protein AED:0.06 eAED:0.06 QI:254/-1/0/1/-1/0/1/0/435
MLSGIKTGKRKRPVVDSGAAACLSRDDVVDSNGPSCSSHVDSSLANAPAASPVDAARGASSSSFNRSAADALRADLLSGSQSTKFAGGSTDHRAATSTIISQLESRGRISRYVLSEKNDNDSVIVNLPGSAAAATRHNNNLRYNSKGKLSRSQQNSLREQNDADLTITEMLQQELQQQQPDMDETYARNIAKMGKSYKKYSNLQQHTSKSGADEDDYLQETSLLSDRLYRPPPSNAIAPSLQHAKETSRALAHQSAFDQWKSKSWWWMESPSFDKRHLIALGDKVSLVLVPRRYALVEGHCYIVPLAYSTSFVDLDEEAWYEVHRFQACLSQMFGMTNKMGLVFLETALHTSKSGSGGGGTQCKMEVIPVSRRVEQDAPFYFKSSLEDMAQEWGTHQKLMVLKPEKKLRNAVPKGFPYFYCGWDGGAGGYVQLIE